MGGHIRYIEAYESGAVAQVLYKGHISPVRSSANF